MTQLRRAVAEAVGTALLLIAVAGSGIMAQRLSGGNDAIALLGNSLATGGALVAIICAFGPISGAHLNPVVSIAAAWQGKLPWQEVPGFILAQTGGAIFGVALANLMFGLPIFEESHHVRSGFAQLLGETIATFGLLATIWGCSRSRSESTPYAVAAYILGAYWFTSSTSFANPAVTIARTLTDSFAGIRAADALPFVAAQCIGAGVATLLFSWLAPIERRAIGTAALPQFPIPAELP